ncbi:MAG: beta-phosphoglucomutase [Anaerolineae bacterium]|nr:beta-phosphoglucomutase [Anaerolineae bacterium]
MVLRALICDLDGVITDTAEYHYQAWKQLADEEGLPFSRADNEHLRGISRRTSLLLLLRGRQVEEAYMQEMMDRKNRYYQALLSQITPDDLLPGVADLFFLLDKANVRLAVASASYNAAFVVERLGITDRLAVLADGSSVKRPKPTPDLFRYTAACLNMLPSECLVIEDAAAGIEAGLNAGMSCLALGPAERFTDVGHRYGPLPRRDDLVGIQIADLESAAQAQRDHTWIVHQSEYRSEHQHHMETIFTTGNGYFCSRGSFEEGVFGDHPLTLAHGVFDDIPVFRTELANLPDWLDLTLTVDEHLFRIDQGVCLSFNRHLDLRQSMLRREVRWQAPNGVVLDLTFERFASYAHEHIGAFRVLITPINRPCRVTIETGINGHVSNEDLLHWNHLAQGQADDHTLWLHSRTRHSDLELVAAATITVSLPVEHICQQCPGHPRLVLSQDVDTAQTLQVDKLVSYTTSRDAAPGAADVVRRAVQALSGLTYETLRAAQVRAWNDLWRDCNVSIEGDDEAQLAIRFHLFQLLIAAPQHDERVSIGAKSLSGLGYRGHVFWDTEIFILPLFSYTQPQLARNMLMYRYHTLAGARHKAAQNGFSGAQYAWESAVTGQEVTPTWVPNFEGDGLVRIWTGDIEIHISADIAYAIVQYWRATGDDDFMRDYGVEIILDTARFWGERVELEEIDGQRRYALRDVIGPDEYHDHVDNNTYTNRMAQWHLQTALDVLDWLAAKYPDKGHELREQLELSHGLLRHWQDVIDHIIVHHDPDSGLMLQFEGFFDLKPIDPEVIAQTNCSMQVALGIDGANESQILKQADVVMLLCLLRDDYDTKTWQRNWDTYMPITDHRYGSSLGPSFHAWAACEMGRPDEGYEHFMLAARADLYDVRGNANDGIHAASAGGLWQVVVFGFAGLRLADKGLMLKPHLPAHWKRVSFTVRYRGESYHIEVTQGGDARIVPQTAN